MPKSNADIEQDKKAKATAMLPFSEKPAQDVNARRETIKQEFMASWEPELKEERIAVKRKQGRELAMRKDKNWEHGRTEGDIKRRCFL